MTPFDMLALAATVLLAVIVLAVLAFAGKRERAAEEQAWADQRDNEGDLT